MSDRILVFGADGFVGHRLVSALLKHGEKPIAISRRTFRNPMPGSENIVAEFHEPDDLIPLLDQVRAIVYLASRSTPGTSAGNPLGELHYNLKPLLVLLQALQQFPDISLLYLSSGGSLYTTEHGEPATERSTVKPRSYHGAAKIAAEHFIGAWSAQYHGRATLLRPSNIYGPGQLVKEGFGIIPTCFAKVVRNEPLQVWGDGSNVRDYLYIDDFVDLCIKVMQKPMPVGSQILNASSGTGISLIELFRAIDHITTRPLTINYEPQRTLDARYIGMDSSMARKNYDWTPLTSLQEGLRKTWDWFNTIPHLPAR